MLKNSFELPQVTRNLLIINAIVWVLCKFCECFSESFKLVEILGLHCVQSKSFFLYQLVTYMFVHEAFSHLFFNMFALYMFGGAIEIAWGKKHFLTYYIVTGIGAGLIQLLVGRLALAPDAVTIGASGSIFGLLLAFCILFPETLLYVMFIPIPVKAKYLVVGYGMLEFIYGISSRKGDNVAHFAHLGGMLFGIFMILYWRKNN